MVVYKLKNGSHNKLLSCWESQLHVNEVKVQRATISSYKPEVFFVIIFKIYVLWKTWKASDKSHHVDQNLLMEKHQLMIINVYRVGETHLLPHTTTTTLHVWLSFQSLLENLHVLSTQGCYSNGCFIDFSYIVAAVYYGS